MAKVQSSFLCLICKQPLDFKDNIDIVDFMVMLLRFYKTHDLCENIPQPIMGKVSAKKPRAKPKKQ